MEIAALTTFVFTMSATPGPNNAMITFAGVNFGFRRSVSHMAGITVGFVLLCLLTALGIGTVMQRFPLIELVIRALGMGYLVYLAYRIATTPAAPAGTVAAGRPMTFLEAFGFQFVNPKGWVMAVTASAFLLTSAAPVLADYLSYATVLITVNITCVIAWNLFGVALRRFLENPRARRIFNFSMAALVLVSAAALLRGAHAPQ